MPDTLRIDDDFTEVNTKSVDERNRISLGNVIDKNKRVKVYKNDRGEILLIPLAEIPESELWLYHNKEALRRVKKGLEDSKAGRIVEVDLDDL